MEYDGILQWAEFVKFFRKFGIVSDALTMEAKWHLLTVKARNLRDKAFKADSFRYYHQENSPGGAAEPETAFLRRIMCSAPKARPLSSWGEDVEPDPNEREIIGPARTVRSTLPISLDNLIDKVKPPSPTPDDNLGITQDETETGEWLSVEDPDQPSRTFAAQKGEGRGVRETRKREGLVIDSPREGDDVGRPSTGTTRPPTGSTERPSSAGSLGIVRSRLWWRSTSRPNSGRIAAKHTILPQRPTSAQAPSARPRPGSARRVVRPASAGTRLTIPND